MNQNTKRRWLAALLGAAAGMVVFFLLYGTSTLHPTYDAWILNGYDEWDIQQHYAGPGWHRHFVYRQHPLGQHLLQGAARGAALHLPVVWVVHAVLLCHAGGSRCASVRPRAGKNWRGSAGVFRTGRSAVCYAAYLVGARVPPYRAGQPVAVFAGAVCLSGIPSKPAQRPCRCWPFWRWASTRTFCRWS